jgi:hypothetical protein
MPMLVNLLDALRKFGRPTQRSALARQDQQLAGKVVLQQSQQQFRSELGSASGFVARTEPEPEVVIPLTDEELAPIHAAANHVTAFLSEFLERPVSTWSLEDLDATFATWSDSEDKRGFSDQEVIQLLGSAFGERCAQELNMRWVWVDDSEGRMLALQGKKKKFRAFPLHSVEKRIAHSEVGFFEPIFIALHSASQNPEYEDESDA